MPLRQRNVYHLRLSSTDVIPLYLYLDEKHVEWMNAKTLKDVVADLKPLIGLKLEYERFAHYGPGGPANAKKATVEVHRGDNYQFAYFLRKTAPNPVLLKTRQYVSSSPKGSSVSITGKPTARKRAQSIAPKSVKRQKSSRPSTIERRKKSVAIVPDSEEESEAEESNFSDDPEQEDSMQHSIARRKSSRIAPEEFSFSDSQKSADEDEGEGENKRGFSHPLNVKTEEPDDVQILPPALGVSARGTLGTDADEVESNLKPRMHLNFRQLRMKDRILCVIVEPWPNLPDVSAGRTTTDLSKQSRAASRAPSLVHTEEKTREQTPLPLFLPNHDSEDREASTAPELFHSGGETLDRNEGEVTYNIEEETEYGMLAFSQVLSNVVGDNLGALDEDDEMDGAALYGDADEIRTMTL